MELNQEQLVHELERKHMAATEALHASKSRVEALEAKVEKLKTDSNLHQQQLDDAKKNEQQVSSELAQVTREKAQLEVQLRSVVSLSDQRLEEIRVERERAAEQAKQLVELQTSETRALQAQARLEAQLAPLQHELSRLQKERENDRYQIEELQTQLVEKSRVLTDFRLKHNKKFAELEHQYAESKEQVDELKQSLQRVQDERKTLKEDLRHAQENVLELQTEHTRAIGYLEKELSAQHRLADLYKDTASDANLQVESLKAKCEALQASLQEAEDALAEESQKVREETQQATLHLFKEQTETSEKKIDELETELKKSMARIQELEAAQTAAANRISAIAELSPTAGDLHLASNGLSPTDMYSRIVDLDKQLQEERSAKETMEKYLERILAEVQAKAPYIDRLKKEQARALASHDQLSERLDICMHELSRAREHLRTAQSEKKIAETERDTLQQSVNDLSKQIQQLLYQSLNSNALSVDSTESLVVFRNVEELQTRNQQLLQIVRELSEKKAEKAGPVVVTIEPDDVCTSAEWEKVQDELNTLRAEREREQEMVAAIVKQRDMYRVLLSQSDTRFAEAERTKDLTPSSPRRSAPIDLIASESYDARLLRELRLEFDDYKKEKQAVVTELRDTLDALRVESSKAKMSAMEAKVQVKTLEEKCALVETRKAESDKELVRVRSKFEQSNSLLIQTQKQVADLTVKLDVGQSELRKLHGDLEKAKTELEFVTKQEERHKTEITTLRSEQTNQVKLMEAVRRIEAHQTDRQAQELDRLQSVVTAIELKLAEKQRELDNAQSLSSAKIAELQLEGKALRKQLDSEKVAHGSVREAKAALDEKVRALNAQVKSLSEEVAVLKVQLKKGAGVAAAERVSSLETALQDAKQELHAALNAKQAAEQHAEQYKVISEANEKSFAVLSASSGKLKSEHDAAVSALQEELSQAKQELSALQKKVIKNIAEENKLREEMDSWDQTKREDLRKANERVLVAESQLSSCKQELTVLKGTVATLEGDLQAAQENYSRELSLHSAAVQKLNEMRKEVDSAARTAKEVEIQRDELQLTLDGIQAKYEKEIQGLKQTVEEAQDASSSLSEQNALLHSQLEVLTQDFNRLQEASTLKAFQERVAVPEQEQEKQVRELRSIISSLRRDLEIAQSKFDVAKQESLRYQTQIKSLEKSVDRLKAEQEVSKQQQVAFLTSDEQNKRSAQLDTLSLLRESNAMLRDENEKNHKKCQEKDAIIQGLEAKIHPLQTSESLLKSQIQTLKEDMESLNQSNKRWKDRVNQLIEKYQQIDPEEHEKVCAERNALKARVDELVEASQASNEDKKRIEELMTEKKHAEERLARMRLFVKDWQQQAKAAKERVTELEANKAELEGKASSEREREKAALDEKVKTLEDQLKVTEQKLRLNEEKLKLSEAEMKSKLDSEGKKNSALKDMNAKLLQRCNVFRQEIAELKARPEVQEPPAQVQPPLPPQSAEKPKEDAVEATPAETETSEVPTPVVESSSTAPPFPPQTVEEPAAPVNPIPPASPPPSAEDPKASTSVADEEKMRELALRSLLLKSKKIPKEPASPARPPSPKAAATAPPVPATPALTVETAAPPASTLNAAAPVFTSGFSAFVSAKGLSATSTVATQEKPSETVVAPKSTNPFLNLAPPSATGGSTGLVFGKPNITLPVPTISTDASTAAASTVVIDSEAEELKRQERALRFNAEKPNKRPAPAAAEGAAPSKKANTDASAADEEETKQDNEGNAGP
ncbi:unnamed protein product [Aphanomyces euteiches]